MLGVRDVAPVGGLIILADYLRFRAQMSRARS
jgi:hypothetical protein